MVIYNMWLFLGDASSSVFNDGSTSTCCFAVYICGLCTAECAKALEETEHLLGEISVMTRKQAPSVEHCASVLSSMEDVVENEVASLSR